MSKYYLNICICILYFVLFFFVFIVIIFISIVLLENKFFELQGEDFFFIIKEFISKGIFDYF